MGIVPDPRTISANSVLPAVRRPFELFTADGLRLVGEAALPVDREPRATIVCVHPLPTHGGMMDSHLFRKAAWRLPALADIAVVRFNLRGTESAAGASEGEFDEAEGEGFDLTAAVEWTLGSELPAPWLVGWSFGTDVVLKHGLIPGLPGAILLSPPLRWSRASDLQAWTVDGRRVVALVPELDDFLPPDAAARAFAPLRQVELIPAEGAKHLWVGESWVRWVLGSIVAVVAPDVPVPLPTLWQGPMERWNDLAGASTSTSTTS
ncbi:MAG: Alpha/beta hydrolase [Actinomycetota bacterium]|nr:Alpha/beta hydrolase [Actinomycetota bacterium]